MATVKPLLAPSPKSLDGAILGTAFGRPWLVLPPQDRWTHFLEGPSWSLLLASPSLSPLKFPTSAKQTFRALEVTSTPHG